jgi:hypothetical protein
MYILKKKATKHSNKRISSFITSNSENPKKKIKKSKETFEPLEFSKGSNSRRNCSSKVPNTTYLLIDNLTLRYR